MTFQEWRSQYPGQLFAIVDAALDTTVVADYCNQGGTNAIPLFAGTAFADQAEQGPWLLPNPAPEFIAAHPQMGGVYVTSDAAIDVVLQHWQSLIEVVFEGEVMWLRYADNRVFPKMLTTMSQQELDDVLGPCLSMWSNHKAWQRTPDADFIPRQAPWFRIHARHLQAVYNEDLHVYVLRRRLWRSIGSVMARCNEPDNAIRQLLVKAKKDGLHEDILNGVIAGGVVLQVGLHLREIQTPLMLTENEFSQVEQWLMKYM